jgi:DHA2 family multidrug resistance protein
LQIFGNGASSVGNTASEALIAVGNVVRHEAFVLAYMDAFWFIAWVLTASIVLLVFLQPPPPNHLTPPRLPDEVMSA